jgi:hypothetical protein
MMRQQKKEPPTINNNKATIFCTKGAKAIRQGNALFKYDEM